jgi:purine-binding chemotaxis protein CheW
MKILIVTIDEESYGLSLEDVREIIRDPDVTHVPNLPEFLSGVFELREQSIPLVDGAERLGYERTGDSSEYSSSKIVIVEYSDELIGIRVDDAESIQETLPEHARDNPSLVEEMGGRFVESILEIPEEKETRSRQVGMGARSAAGENDEDSESEDEDERSTRTVMMLDLDELFTGEEMSAIRRASEGTSTEPTSSTKESNHES